MNSKKKELEKFEFMINKSKAKAYSKLSLERPLTEAELRDFRLTMKKLKKIVD